MLDIADADAMANEGGGASLQQLPAAIVLLPLVQLLQHVHLLGQRSLGLRELQGGGRVHRQIVGRALQIEYSKIGWSLGQYVYRKIGLQPGVDLSLWLDQSLGQQSNTRTHWLEPGAVQD